MLRIACFCNGTEKLPLGNTGQCHQCSDFRHYRVTKGRHTYQLNCIAKLSHTDEEQLRVVRHCILRVGSLDLRHHRVTECSRLTLRIGDFSHTIRKIDRRRVGQIDRYQFVDDRQDQHVAGSR